MANMPSARGWSPGACRGVGGWVRSLREGQEQMEGCVQDQHVPCGPPSSWRGQGQPLRCQEGSVSQMLLGSLSPAPRVQARQSLPPCRRPGAPRVLRHPALPPGLFPLLLWPCVPRLVLTPQQHMALAPCLAASLLPHREDVPLLATVTRAALSPLGGSVCLPESTLDPCGGATSADMPAVLAGPSLAPPTGPRRRHFWKLHKTKSDFSRLGGFDVASKSVPFHSKTRGHAGPNSRTLEPPRPVAKS